MSACPTCGAEVPRDALACPRCSAATTVPLTMEQRNWLRANMVLPLVFLALLLGGIMALGACVIGPVLTHPVVRLGAGVAAALMMGVVGISVMHVRSHWADARLGVAQVRVARLVRKHETGQSPRTFYAELEGIGTVIVMHDLYERLEEGGRYRVTFSPHTRRGWAMEPSRQGSDGSGGL